MCKIIHDVGKHRDAKGGEVADQQFMNFTRKVDLSKWICPIGRKDCVRNCGNYGCGN